MTQIQIVIVDQTNSIDANLLHSAALALNSQVTQDLPQYWSGISASVSNAPQLSAVPHGAWPVFLVTQLPEGEGGFHLDDNKQPYAKVIASADDDSWTIDASHEIIEMLVDPFGNRMQASQAITIQGAQVVDTSGTFNYLVEACDPCEANDFAYDIAGVAVSDFITPHFYDATVVTGTKYSFRGNLTRPRQLLKGGYISYQQANGSWQQILWVDPSEPPQFNNLSDVAAVRSWREEVHSAMGPHLDGAKHAQRRKPHGLPRQIAARVLEHHGHRSGEAKAKRAKELAARYRL